MRRLAALALLPLTACGVDTVEANGELGNLGFSLVSDWYVDDASLTDVGLVTAHAHSFVVALTAAGEELADGDGGALRFRATPDDGVLLAASDPDAESEQPPSVELTVEDPGEVALEATLHGELFDRITLRFDAPRRLDLALFARGPWDQEFDRLDAADVIEVAEGTQLAWLPIPVDAGGERLVGDVATDLSADPAELVVPTSNVLHVNEDEVTDSTEVPSLVFVEPGAVAITVADTRNSAEGVQAFSIVE